MSAQQRTTTVILLLSVLVSLSSSCKSSGPPYSPQAALKTFLLPQGFRIELVAAEPEVVNPVAMAFDEQGRLFVVEMGDYPISKEPLSRIKLLEGRDGDGKFERSTLFVDGLHFAHGVMPWKKGIIVTYTASVREVVLEGFFKEPTRLPALLEAIEAQTVQAWSLSRARRVQLAQFRDEKIRKRAQSLFAGILQ